MAGNISIALQIGSGRLRSQLEEIVASHSEFRLKEQGESAFPDILIMELDDADATRTFSHISTLRKSAPQTEIFLTGARTDTEVLLESLKTGVKEFLSQPLTREVVEQAFSRFKVRYEERHHGQQGRRGTILSIIGGKEGVGTTTVAVNLAMGLQQLQTRKSLVLVDLDLQGGELPLFLDLKPPHGLSDIVGDPSRLDSTFLTSILSTHPSGISLLPLGDEDLVRASSSRNWVAQPFDLLCSLFDYIVVDCGHALNPVTTEVLERSSSILVVSTLSVPVICRTKRLLESLQLVESSDQKIKVIVNRYTATSSVPLDETEDILQHKALWLIPNDYDVTSRAINEGQPLTLVAPRAPITKMFGDLAASFLEEQREQKERSRFATYMQALKEKWTTA